MIPTLCSACYIMMVTPFRNTENPNILLFSLLPFNIKTMFTTKEIRIMARTKMKVSWRKLFMVYNMFPLASEFLHSLLILLLDNMETFQTNSDIHNIS